ncbi:MAG: hypothetical protein JO316_26240 [Abitibacteriaceae bacterium]|nr:hypothetical protein [Abditibacteriaceae bacterium]MBV9868861.1 hypothetical protein [Abditibacteriaceae bacterium]
MELFFLFAIVPTIFAVAEVVVWMCEIKHTQAQKQYFLQDHSVTVEVSDNGGYQVRD